MKRRKFLQLAGGASIAFPTLTLAQRNTNPPVVAYLTPFTKEMATEGTADLRAGLKQAGLVEGVDYSLALRFANGDVSRVPELTRELLALKPRVFVSAASTSALSTTRKEAPDIPVVVTGLAADPISMGFAESYARPGGMITGNTMNAVGGEEALTTKRIGFFRELVPNLARLGMVHFVESVNPVAAGNLSLPERRALRKVSEHFGFELLNYEIRTIDDFDGAVSAGLQDGVSAFYISGDPRMNFDIPRVASSLEKSEKPTCAVYPFWAQRGLLMSYSNDLHDMRRRAGFQVAKILRGARPGDVPFEQAVKYTLVINMKTAKRLGITPPPTLLAATDELVE
ncbi:ABC transporter substrate-binding protein [Bradyrhizobium liaoningense]|uniref:ABC transporter substrate-binding protein n=1 Tax=Bradyrhizobium liaoningense TaxID=43992 RepID=UPI001BA8DF76|nr:ABC transporter substrate-binding protein [Bradyrhizobium liaoningense]MBR0741252.1 ABC transporter substrate-binding protein [Bradyrhizobium liaoningense]